MFQFNKYIFIICLTVLFLNSCIKVVKDMELEEEDPKIVLNAVADIDSVFKVHVTRSIGAMELERPYYIPGAIVKVISSQKIDTLNEYNDGFYYKTGFKPVEGKLYKVEVEAKNYVSVDAYVKIPSRPVIIKTDTTTVAESEDIEFIEYYLQISVTLEHNPGIRNYFMIELKSSDPMYNETLGNNILIKSNDPKMEIAIDYFDVYPVYTDQSVQWANKLVFTDKLMNNKTGNILFDINKEQDISSLKIILTEISEDYYLYLKQLSIYSDDPFENFFVEKVSSYTNVSNGIGIVAGEASISQPIF